MSVYQEGILKSIEVLEGVITFNQNFIGLTPSTHDLSITIKLLCL